MPDFYSEEELRKYLLDHSKTAVFRAQTKAYRIIDKFLIKYYMEFNPSEYIRTRQLLHSLVKGNVRPIANGYEAEVYFDAGKLNYAKGVTQLKSTSETGRTGLATWSGADVLENAAQGSHGGYKSGTAIYNEPLAILTAEHIDILKKSLKQAGIPVQ